MLHIQNLHASIDGIEILRGLNLDVNAGEVHAIMGPNGSGKSPLAQVLAGRDIFSVSADELSYEGRNLLEMPAEIRAREGIFLAFQYPIEIPGVSNLYFLRSAVNAVRAHRGIPELDAMDFMSMAKLRAERFGLDDAMLKRSVNEGFSGGEKPSFTERLSIASSRPKRSARSFAMDMKSIASSSGMPRCARTALTADLRKYRLLTPGISIGY